MNLALAESAFVGFYAQLNCFLLLVRVRVGCANFRAPLIKQRTRLEDRHACCEGKHETTWLTSAFIIQMMDQPINSVGYVEVLK